MDICICLFVSSSVVTTLGDKVSHPLYRVIATTLREYLELANLVSRC